MFPHRNIQKYTSSHNQIDHILTDGRWHPSILVVRRCRGADCDTDHCLVVAKFREKLAASKQTEEKFEGESFNLRKLN